MNKYYKNNEVKLREMQSKNPKDYWKYLNKIKTKKSIDMPTLDSMYDYFKEANNNLYHDVNDNDIINNIDLTNDSVLNSYITSEEIKKNVSKH
jgi:hypothetical protein